MKKEALYKKQKDQKKKTNTIQIARIDKGDIRILKNHFGLSSEQIRALTEKDFDDYMNKFEFDFGDTDYSARIVSGRQD